MKDFKASKVVFNLPEQLEPNTSYWVRSGEGFDLYLSDLTGTVAHKHNASSGAIGITYPIKISEGGTGATTAEEARINLGLDNTVSNLNFTQYFNQAMSIQ